MKIALRIRLLQRAASGMTGLLLITSAPAFASSLFNMNWTGPYGTGAALLTATMQGTNKYLVTSLTGTQHGLSLTLLAPGTYGDNNNAIYQPPTYANVLDIHGLAFTDGTNSYDAFAFTLPGLSNTYAECNSSFLTCNSALNLADAGALTSLTITPDVSAAPEPRSGWLLFLGLAVFVGISQRRRVSTSRAS